MTLPRPLKSYQAEQRWHFTRIWVPSRLRLARRSESGKSNSTRSRCQRRKLFATRRPRSHLWAIVALERPAWVGGWRTDPSEITSSHGQQFWVAPELATTRADGTLCEAVLWDLAGQPDYRLTHALFLDDVDLALVVFDPTTRQDPLKGVEYWLKQLTLRGQTLETILVGARIDRGSLTLTPEELARFCETML